MDSGCGEALRSILAKKTGRAVAAKQVAEWIAAERGYRWVGAYEVTASEIGMIACTGSKPPSFPRFPVSRGLCGAAVASKAIVNVGDVRKDPRWLETFGSTRSEIIVPVLGSNGGVRGLIDVESEQLNAFGQADEEFLRDCATEITGLFQDVVAMTPPRRFRVLFICVGNACRSPMAEAIARRDAEDVIEAYSAGIYPLGDLPELTRQTLMAKGCSIEGLCSKRVTRKMLREADVIVNLSGLPLDHIINGQFGFEAQEACEIQANVEEWDIADPYGSNAELYQQNFREIGKRVERLAERLRAVRRAHE
jgi:L-methionine (R)-S-oxide reductase